MRIIYLKWQIKAAGWLHISCPKLPIYAMISRPTPSTQNKYAALLEIAISASLKRKELGRPLPSGPLSLPAPLSAPQLEKLRKRLHAQAMQDHEDGYT
jgi:hypothetical protein